MTDEQHDRGSAKHMNYTMTLTATCTNQEHMMNKGVECSAGVSSEYTNGMNSFLSASVGEKKKWDEKVVPTCSTSQVLPLPLPAMFAREREEMGWCWSGTEMLTHEVHLAIRVGPLCQVPCKWQAHRFKD